MAPEAGSSAVPPTVRDGLALGAMLGALGGVAFALLELGAAASFGMSWSVNDPALNLLVLGVGGALAGGLTGTLLVLAGAVPAVGRLDPWARVVVGCALGPWAVRAGMNAVVVRAHFPGGLPGCVVATELCFTLLWLVGSRTLAGRIHGFGSALVVGLFAAVLPLAGVFAVLGYFFAGRGGADPAVAILVGSALAGTLVLAAGPLARRPPVGIVVTAALLAAAAAWIPPARGASPTATPPADAPNVLLIVLDTLRADAVSAYGVLEGTTPRLDAFAAEGMLWEDAIVPGNWTIPGHASLFTGAQVTRHGAGKVREVLRLNPSGSDDEPLPTIAEVLHGGGYTTAAFVCNGQLDRRKGFARGFEEYHEMWRAKKGYFDLVGKLRRRFSSEGTDKGGARTVRGLAQWMRAQDNEPPWFCFVNFMEPHGPYDAPQPWLEDWAPGTTRAEARRQYTEARNYRFGGAPRELCGDLWDQYLACVAYQDAVMGDLLDHLEAAGLADDTLVLVTSDHGENFGWGGQLFHGVDLNDDLIDVPLIARGPGITPGRSDFPATLLDVLPTVLARCGLPPLPEDPGRPGVDLLGDADAVRIRIAERYPWYLTTIEELAAERPDVDPSAGPGRAAILFGAHRASRIDPEGQVEEPVVVEVADHPPVPPFDDGRVVLPEGEATAEARTLIDWLDRARSTWPWAQDPSPSELPELDAETLAELRKLGYVDG